MARRLELFVATGASPHTCLVPALDELAENRAQKR
jgi:hypothetical protein